MIAAEMRPDESDIKEGEEDEPKADMFIMEKPTASQTREAQYSLYNFAKIRL